jgi:hypothetical protein
VLHYSSGSSLEVLDRYQKTVPLAKQMKIKLEDALTLTLSFARRIGGFQIPRKRLTGGNPETLNGTAQIKEPHLGSSLD